MPVANIRPLSDQAGAVLDAAEPHEVLGSSMPMNGLNARHRHARRACRVAAPRLTSTLTTALGSAALAERQRQIIEENRCRAPVRTENTMLQMPRVLTTPGLGLTNGVGMVRRRSTWRLPPRVRVGGQKSSDFPASSARQAALAPGLLSRIRRTTG